MSEMIRLSKIVRCPFPCPTGLAAKSKVMAKEDEKIFDAIRRVGCPEGALIIWDEKMV